MSITVRTRNVKPFPYNLTNDTIKLHIGILDNKNPSYLENITISVYSNFNGSILYHGDYTTNTYGVAHVTYNTDLISYKDIDTGLMWCTFTYNSVSYTSNKARVNFIYDTGYDVDLYIINANTPATRITISGDYNCYDANDYNSRLASGEYFIYDREKQ